MRLCFTARAPAEREGTGGKMEGVVKRRVEKCKRQYLQETVGIIIAAKSLQFKFQRCD